MFQTVTIGFPMVLLWNILKVLIYQGSVGLLYNGIEVRGMSYLFSGIIKCKNCGGNYRGRKERSHKGYICSTYNNYPDKCSRFVVREENLIEVIKSHFGSDELTISEIHSIEVYTNDKKIVINYSDNSQSILSGKIYSV
jgi:hypothetical protein